MRLVVFVICLFSVFNVSQGQVSTFSKVYDFDTTWEVASSVIVLDDGYLLCGNGESSQTNPWVSIKFVRTDLYGNVLWEKVMGEPVKSYFAGNANAIHLDDNGNYYLVGTINDSTISSAAVVWKLNNQLDTIWTYSVNPGGFQLFYSGGFTDCGNFTSVGATSTLGLGSSDFLVCLVDTNGSEVWKQPYGASGYEVATNVDVTGDCSLLVAGVQSNIANTERDPILYKLDNNGSVLWHETYGTSNYDCGLGGVFELNSGDILISGCLDTLDNFDTKSFISLLDSNGAVKWRKIFGDNSRQGIWSFVEENGFVTIVGVRRSEEISNDVGFLLKIDSYGNIIWERDYYHLAFPGPDGLQRSTSWFRDIELAPDGGYIVCGMARGLIVEPQTTQDFWLVKLDSMGCLEPGCDTLTGIRESTFVGDEVVVYPNPVRNYLNIEFNNYYKGMNIRLYNPLGELVLEKPLIENLSKITLELPQGGYIYAVSTPNKLLKTGKLLVLE